MTKKPKPKRAEIAPVSTPPPTDPSRTRERDARFSAPFVAVLTEAKESISDALARMRGQESPAPLVDGPAWLDGFRVRVTETRAADATALAAVGARAELVANALDVLLAAMHGEAEHLEDVRALTAGRATAKKRGIGGMATAAPLNTFARGLRDRISAWRDHGVLAGDEEAARAIGVRTAADVLASMALAAGTAPDPPRPARKPWRDEVAGYIASQIEKRLRCDVDADIVLRAMPKGDAPDVFALDDDDTEKAIRAALRLAGVEGHAAANMFKDRAMARVRARQRTRGNKRRVLLIRQ